MITFLVKKGYEYTLKHYLNSKWTSDFKGEIQVLNYTQLQLLINQPSHLIVFLDHERYTPGERNFLIKIWKHFKERYPQLTIWNHPGKILGRLELIQLLKRKKINQYTAYRIKDDLSRIRFPVFLRSASHHNGSLTGLIYNVSDLQNEITNWSFPRNKYLPNDLLVVEFCDTSSNNKYTKHSAMQFNGVIIPMLMDKSKNWIVKSNPRNYDRNFCREILNFSITNPHKEFVSGIFNLANVDYGRLDYSWNEGNPQVWEINSNPIIKWPERKMTKILESLDPEIVKCWEEIIRVIFSKMSSQFKEILKNEVVIIKELYPMSITRMHFLHNREKISKKVRFTIASLFKKT